MVSMSDFNSEKNRAQPKNASPGSPETPPPNVKIYDRPDRTGPTPVMIIVGLIVLIIIGVIVYKMFVH